MSSRRKTAIAVGILFIVATVASILGSAILGSLLDGSDYLDTLSEQGGRVVAAALIFMIAATAAFGTACLLFPILREHAEGLATSYVGLRAFENVFYVLGAVALLIMLSLGQSAAVGGADSGALALLGAMLFALHQWAVLVGTLLFAGLGSFVLNYVLYRSELVPRWLAVWGLIGAALVFLYGLLGLFGVPSGLGSPFMLLAMPIAVQEMVFAGWLLARGFGAPALPPDRPALSDRPARVEAPHTTVGR